MCDLVIIGGGSAGLTAAIYAARAGLDFIVLEQDGWGGGQITSAHMVENYPGLPNISGADLGEAIKNHAAALGAKIEYGVVDRIEDHNEYKSIILNSGDVIDTKTVICATGAAPRKFNAAGEEDFLGRGVSYCAVCDGAFFAGEDVVVIGGGDTAVEDAIYLSSICRNVTLVHRRETFRAAKTRADKLLTLPNVTVRYNETLDAITGDERVRGVDLKGVDGISHYNADGVFIAVGTVPETKYLSSLPIELEDGYVVAGEDCKTSVDGIFAAGDIRKKPLRQVVTAVADGANAAISAIEYLRK
jgi:thioredoxin reductase (NADPH)